MDWEQKEIRGDAQKWSSSAPFWNQRTIFQDAGGVKMDHLIPVLWLERSSTGISLISFQKPLVLPVREYILLFPCSAVKLCDGHFSNEEKTVILNMFKLNSIFKGTFWDKDRHICSFRGFCDKQ